MFCVASSDPRPWHPETGIHRYERFHLHDGLAGATRATGVVDGQLWRRRDLPEARIGWPPADKHNARWIVASPPVARAPLLTFSRPPSSFFFAPCRLTGCFVHRHRCSYLLTSTIPISSIESGRQRGPSRRTRLSPAAVQSVRHTIDGAETVSISRTRSLDVGQARRFWSFGDRCAVDSGEWMHLRNDHGTLEDKATTLIELQCLRRSDGPR